MDSLKSMDSFGGSAVRNFTDKGDASCSEKSNSLVEDPQKLLGRGGVEELINKYRMDFHHLIDTFKEVEEELINKYRMDFHHLIDTFKEVENVSNNQVYDIFIKAIFRGVDNKGNRQDVYDDVRKEFVNFYKTYINPVSDLEYSDIEDYNLIEKSNDFKVYNDIAYKTKDNRVIILLEHQSTYNPNMLLRELVYYVLMIKRFTDDQGGLFISHKINPPRPEFYVLETMKKNFVVKEQYSEEELNQEIVTFREERLFEEDAEFLNAKIKFITLDLGTIYKLYHSGRLQPDIITTFACFMQELFFNTRRIIKNKRSNLGSITTKELIKRINSLKKMGVDSRVFQSESLELNKRIRAQAFEDTVEMYKDTALGKIFRRLEVSAMMKDARNNFANTENVSILDLELALCDAEERAETAEEHAKIAKARTEIAEERAETAEARAETAEARVKELERQIFLLTR